MAPRLIVHAAVVALAAAGLAGCEGCEDGGRSCETRDDCPAGQICLDGRCASPGDGGLDGGEDADVDGGVDADGDGGDGGDGGGPAVCGDGLLADDEACDDGNAEGSDGCSAACDEVEAGFACPAPGVGCVRIVVCGNARIEGDESCDDHNTTPGDGCDESCHLELGWICPVVGAACVAAACGDGIVAGFEVCDDGDTEGGDGCDETCHLEEGWECDPPGSDCEPTVCGDGVVEGSEECEDGNVDVGDGCTPFCLREPRCVDGICEAVCGDEVVWAPEACDDGNTISGDGCSATCQVEVGFDCVETELAPPDEVRLPVTMRDFIAACGTSARLPDDDPAAVPPYGHRDFQCYLNGLTRGMVLDELGADGRPVWVASSGTFDAASFSRWYVSDPDYNRAVATHLVLPAIGGGAYQLASAAFFPFDGAGFVAEDCGGAPCEVPLTDGHNFHFTSEVRYWFQYGGAELLEFTGDDDVWVFINGRLAVDLGGVHGAVDGSVDLSDPVVADRLGLALGGVYEAVVFQAERHTTQSNYRLTLTNFGRAPSVCASTCGDGVASSVEVCDDGVNDGSYGGCTPDCLFGPYCGDGIVQEEHGEICDDGLNLGGTASACAPGCRSVGALCGDGVVQTGAGEQCDDGNTVSGDGCSADCRIEVT